MDEVYSGNSDEQRSAEAVMIRLLAQELGMRLAPRRVDLPRGCHIEVDGCSEDFSVMVEAWAHQGSPRSAQRAKVCKDALKLAFAARAMAGNTRTILLFSDESAARPFLSRGWETAALREFGIEVHLVRLPSQTRELVLAAQRRQYR